MNRHELYAAYCQGFRDGSGVKALNHDNYRNVPERLEYERGFQDGTVAKNAAYAKAQHRLGVPRESHSHPQP